MSDVSAEGGTAGSTGAVPIVATPHYREAFQRALPAAQALDQNTLIPINIDVPTAITTVIGALPEIRALRERVAAELPKFDRQHFDELETFALAIGHAHAQYLAASAPAEPIQVLNEQGLALRDILYSDALALSNRSLINGERLADFKTTTGYKNLAFDLLGLAALLRKNWDKISSKTALTLTELDQAEVLGEQLVNAVGVREQAPAIVADVAEQRQRIFTLFVNAYDEVRRAIGYLRWDEDDLENIAPSLYSARKNRRGKTDLPQPGPTPTTPGAIGNAPIPATAPGSAGPSTPAAIGMPGSSPFSTS